MSAASFAAHRNSEHPKRQEKGGFVLLVLGGSRLQGTACAACWGVQQRHTDGRKENEVIYSRILVGMHWGRD